MANKTKEPEKPDAKQLDVSKDASVDFPVDVIATEADPYHKTGDKFKAGSKKAAELVKRGWVTMATMAMIALIVFASFGANAQASVIASLYNATNTYSLAKLNAATVTQDTVTDTGTGAIYAKRIAGPGAVTIQVNITKVSGTVTGTLILSGSLDGITYFPINTEETQTALATKAFTNVTGTTGYGWRLSKSPFLYYSVGVSGGTTTVYYLSGLILKH